jgi:TolA-binding protein
MKKSFLSAIAFLFSAAILLAGCYQPLRQSDGGLSSPGQRGAARNYPGSKRGVYQGAPNTGDFPGADAPSGQRQDYIDMPEDQPIRATTINQEETLPSMSYVNERLAEYGKKLERWRELDRQSSATAVSPEESAELVSCFQQLQKVMNGYSALRASMLDKTNAAAGRAPMANIRDLYKTDIDFLEDRCGLMLTEKTSAPRIADSQLQATEDTLLRNYAAGNYETASQLWRAMPADQGVKMRVSAQNAAAQSMLRQEDEKGAAAIYRKLLQRLNDEDSPDSLTMRRNLADISLAAGDATEALRQYRLVDTDYQKLATTADWAKRQTEMVTSGQRNKQEFQDYSNIMRRWLIYTPARDGFTVSALADNFIQKYPHSQVVDNAKYIRDDSKARAERWINGLVSNADKMAARKKFQEAAKTIDSAPPADIVGGEQKSVPQQKGEEVGSAAAVDQETTPQEGEQELQRQWNNGLLLAQNGRYDEAIDVFTSLEGSDYADQAKAKVREISLQAAKDERRKAADLYVRYSRTTDIGAKKKLLLESRRILKDILVKYPEVEITPKVVSNIERVEQEIRSVDPNLLQSADEPGPAAGGGLR